MSTSLDQALEDVRAALETSSGAVEAARTTVAEGATGPEDVQTANTNRLGLLVRRHSLLEGLRDAIDALHEDGYPEHPTSERARAPEPEPEPEP